MRKRKNTLQKLIETKYIFVQMHANTNQTKILQNIDTNVNQNNQKNLTFYFRFTFIPSFY